MTFVLDSERMQSDIGFTMTGVFDFHICFYFLRVVSDTKLYLDSSCRYVLWGLESNN